MSRFACLFGPAMSVCFSCDHFKINNQCCTPAAFTVSSSSNNVDLLHKRLGHPTVHTLKCVLKSCNQFADINKISILSFCDTCQYGKSHLQYFNSFNIKTTKLLQLLYADVWGPSSTASTQGYFYYLSTLDDYSTFTWIFPLTAKSDALGVFTTFKTFIEQHVNRKIKTIQTDWGGGESSYLFLLYSYLLRYILDIHALTFITKMVELKRNIDIQLILDSLYQLKLNFLSLFGGMHSTQQCILLIGC